MNGLGFQSRAKTWQLRFLRRVVVDGRGSILSSGERRELRLVALGEISAGRAALEGAPVAPGSQAILDASRDETRQPRTLFQPETAFCLDGTASYTTSVAHDEEPLQV